MTKRAALAALTLAMLVPSLSTSIASGAAPTLAVAFDATFAQVQWVVLAYLVAVTALTVVAGHVGDTTGRKRLFLIGIALFGVMSAACAAAPTLGVLVAARAGQGVGAAIMMALTVAFVGEAVPRERIGTAMGLLGTVSAVGTALGPPVGGALITAFGWEAIFLLTVPLSATAFVLAYRYLPDAPKAPRARLSLEVLRDRARATNLLLSAIATTVLMSTLVVGPFYLTGALGLDAAVVGAVMAAGPVVAALGGLPAGRVVDRLGTRRTTALGLGGMAAGCLALATLPESLGVPGYVIPIVVITGSFAQFQAANSTEVVATAPATGRGAIAGMLALSRQVGLILGTAAMGWVFTTAAGTSDITGAAPGDVADALRTTFATGAALVAGALLLATVGRRTASPMGENVATRV
ncbi:MFS transporter [Actinokineospora terrae]|uniref:Predicted arabinose efflux permease, MFS family n=1 Tax=Actinokineospora terrae TaxID=155974 RepID=A0A1H9TBJ6_9PSEU|nr:MFS transporter [Actinokineospora terrae]SER94498.1 Predicted arabinose efflux permease, MFS family [Actinokineospora terrae]